MSTNTLIYVNTSSRLLQMKRNLCNFLFCDEMSELRARIGDGEGEIKFKLFCFFK